MDNTLLEKIQHMNNEIEFANTVINLQFLLLEVIAGPCWRAGTIYFLITPNKMFLHMSAALKHKIKKNIRPINVLIHSVVFLLFLKSMRAETLWTEGKRQHGTLQGISSFKPL